MSMKTIFTCEKCGESWEYATKGCPQVVNIAARVNWGNSYDAFQQDSWSSDLLSMNCCRPCAEALNLQMPREKQKPEEKDKSPNATTEEMLVNLLETLGFNREH